jgi:hypothetical protein
MNSNKLGSKENPVRLHEWEIEDLRNVLIRADRSYDLTKDEDKEKVRNEARAKILKRWPMLYDNAYICKLPWDEFAYQAYLVLGGNKLT